MGQVTLRYLMLPGLSWWGRGSTELFHLPCLLACFVLHVLWRLALETDLKIEREWRGTLQQTLDKEKAKAAKLQTDIQHLEETKKVCHCRFCFICSFSYFSRPLLWLYCSFFFLILYMSMKTEWSVTNLFTCIPILLWTWVGLLLPLSLICGIYGTCCISPCFTLMLCN